MQLQRVTGGCTKGQRVTGGWVGAHVRLTRVISACWPAQGPVRVTAPSGSCGEERAHLGLKGADATHLTEVYALVQLRHKKNISEASLYKYALGGYWCAEPHKWRKIRNYWHIWKLKILRHHFSFTACGLHVPVSLVKVIICHRLKKYWAQGKKSVIQR